MKTVNKDIACLICACNEENTIADVIAGCKKYLDSIFVVDDGSADKTAEIAKKAGAEVIRHEKNTGKGMALRTGIENIIAKGFNVFITLDADLQHDPDEIPKFIDFFRNNFGDIIIGDRLWDSSMPLYRYIPNRIGVYLISKAAHCIISDTQSGFRLYNKKIFDKISLNTTGFETETEVLLKAGRAGFSIKTIPVKAIYPENYKTRFRPVRDFYKISILVLKITFCGGVR